MSQPSKIHIPPYPEDPRFRLQIIEPKYSNRSNKRLRAIRAQLDKWSLYGAPNRPRKYEVRNSYEADMVTTWCERLGLKCRKVIVRSIPAHKNYSVTWFPDCRHCWSCICCDHSNDHSCSNGYIEPKVRSLTPYQYVEVGSDLN